MKIEKDGVTIEIEKPVIEGWEFHNYRQVQYSENFYDGGYDKITNWICKRKTSACYWIATRLVKPVSEGWEFTEYRPAQYNESIYDNDGYIVTWICKRESPRCYWIATRPQEKKNRRVVRYKILPDYVGRLSIIRDACKADDYASIDCLIRHKDFIGFEFEDSEIVSRKSIKYWWVEDRVYFDCPTVKEIESGKIEVRHAVSALFLEDV